MKKIVGILFGIGFFCFVAAGFFWFFSTPESAYFEYEKMTVSLNSKTKLNLFNKDYEEVEFISSDENIITVDEDGTINALNVGSVVVQAVDKEDKEKILCDCSITVKER